MPTVNVYYSEDAQAERFDTGTTARLRVFVAERLTCGDITLVPGEVTIRLIKVHSASQMMGDIEFDVHAHEFAERVERQDELCREIVAFVKDELGVASDPKAWLVLSQLGHSV